MADAAAAAIDLPILKLKLCGDNSDLARVEAVRAAAQTHACSSTPTNRGRLVIIETRSPR